jgi:hypothetical protein
MGYIIAVLDSYSGYAWVSYTPLPPSTKELVGLVERIRLETGEAFDELVTDNGPQMTSQAFTDYLVKRNCLHQQTPVYSSQNNGKVERFFRTLQDRLRASFYGVEKYGDKEFAASVERIVWTYNCTRAKGHYLSPYEICRNSHFPWFFNEPELRDWRPTTNEIREQEDVTAEWTLYSHLDSAVSKNTSIPENLSVRQAMLLDSFPKPGERWMLREHNPRKFQSRFVPVDILKVITPTTFTVMYARDHLIRKVPFSHLRRFKYEALRLPGGQTREDRLSRLQSLLKEQPNLVRRSQRGRKRKVTPDGSSDIFGAKLAKIGTYVPGIPLASDVSSPKHKGQTLQSHATTH